MRAPTTYHRVRDLVLIAAVCGLLTAIGLVALAILLVATC